MQRYVRCEKKSYYLVWFQFIFKFNCESLNQNTIYKQSRDITKITFMKTFEAKKGEESMKIET